MLILITGKSGSGKTTLAEILSKKLKYKHIDIDKIGFSVYELPEVAQKAKELFGQEIFDNDTLNKPKLGQMVFNDRTSKKIEDFRAYIWEYINKLINLDETNNAVIEYILLPETKYWKLNAIKILIKPSDNQLRKQNVMLRDGISLESIEERDQFGIDYNENDFDFVFDNDYVIKHLKQIAVKIVNFIENK